MLKFHYVMLWDLEFFGSGTGGYTFYVGLRSNLAYSSEMTWN